MLSRFPLLAAASALLSLASAAPTVAAGEKLRGVTDPIFHLYLQVGEGTFSSSCLGRNDYFASCIKSLILENIDGTSAVVAAEATAGEFTISESVQETTSSKYLNIQEADTSFKPLAFGAKENFSGWGLEGDTLITTEASEYGRRRFLDILTPFLRGILKGYILGCGDRLTLAGGLSRTQLPRVRDGNSGCV